jgi:hypothetical protein
VPRAAPAPAPLLPGLALACSCLSTSRRRRPSRHDSRRPPAPAPARPRLLLDLEHILEHPKYSLLLSRDCISTANSFPDHRTSPDLLRSPWMPSSAAHADFHPWSSAPRAPPRPPGAPQPVQFRSRALERPDHYASELELPPPLGLAVVPLIHYLLAPDKNTASTTSSRERCLATSPPPSCPPATGTSTTSLGPPLPAPVHRCYAASAPLFPDTGHPHDRRESLSISPHLPLAADEPSRRNLNGTDRNSCVARPTIYL